MIVGLVRDTCPLNALNYCTTINFAWINVLNYFYFDDDDMCFMILKNIFIFLKIKVMFSRFDG